MEERSSTVNFAPAAAAGPSSAPATAGGADRRVSLTNRLSRGDTITIAGKTMTVKEKITFRLRVRLLLSSMNAELSMLAVVLVYCAFVFVELALDDQNIRTLIDTETRRVLKDVFLWADFVFLIFFMVELAVKLYAFGLSYLRDLFNGIDALIVVVSFALALVAVELELGASSDQLMRAMPVLRVVKVVRLLRVVLMMTRLQRSRERYRRMKMVGLAAPVEKVFEIIGDLRARESTHPEDDKALAWIMDLIAKEELYKANFNDSKHSSGMHLTSEMTDWLRSNLTGGVSAGGLLKGGGGGAAGDKQRSGSVVEDAISGAKKNDAKKGGSEVVEGKVRRTSLLQHTIPPWITKSIGESRCACGEEEPPHSHT